jgi:cyclophilin family peptidyl-prolyl cis-trans isomerase
MPQLVGQPCVVCNQRIVAARDAEFCSACGNAVHQRCREAYRSPADSLRCRRCGGEAAPAPVAEAPARLHSVPLLLALAAAAVIAIIFFAWPSVDRSQALEENSVNAKEKPDPQAAQKGRPIVEIETTLGTIRAELFADKAPKTVQNFVELVNQKYYDGIVFHRVIRDFMIQTGDPLGTGTGGRTDKGLPAKQVPDEFHRELRHKGPGILSMANTGQPNTGDTQFFITTVDTPWLDDKHSVFGKVISGMDVIRKIERTDTDAQDRPRKEVKMTRVRLVPPQQQKQQP